MHAHVRAVEAALPGMLPLPGEGSLAGNLRAWLDRALALHAAILPALAGLTTQPKLLARLAESPALPGGDPGVRAEFADYLRAEQRLGRVAPTADPRAAATLLVGVCHDLVLGRLLDPAGAPPRTDPELVDALVDTLLRGVAAAGSG
ncbi:hypothetical protein [Micromonospora sp. WMMD980]|uniref:hypothetical protein n=1 Tax=Micromonospora sp. WMMD980 TaxID=3016088 RepID=UPI002417F69A|nr:hypothetical protein [Micromonospora sp. WMMD980]MDG4801657.1 hypothetical protein [Micromonospora sp. WMMD980]